MFYQRKLGYMFYPTIKEVAKAASAGSINSMRQSAAITISSDLAKLDIRFPTEDKGTTFRKINGQLGQNRLEDIYTALCETDELSDFFTGLKAHIANLKGIDHSLERMIAEEEGREFRKDSPYFNFEDLSLLEIEKIEHAYIASNDIVDFIKSYREQCKFSPPKFSWIGQSATDYFIPLRKGQRIISWIHELKIGNRKGQLVEPSFEFFPVFSLKEEKRFSYFELHLVIMESLSKSSGYYYNFIGQSLLHDPDTLQNLPAYLRAGARKAGIKANHKEFDAIIESIHYVHAAFFPFANTNLNDIHSKTAIPPINPHVIGLPEQGYSKHRENYIIVQRALWAHATAGEFDYSILQQ